MGDVGDTGTARGSTLPVVGRPSWRLEPCRPSILIEDFREERPRFSLGPRVTADPLLVLHPPGYQFVVRVGRMLTAAKRDYERTVGTHREFRPRIQSRVEHR